MTTWGRWERSGVAALRMARHSLLCGTGALTTYPFTKHVQSLHVAASFGAIMLLWVAYAFFSAAMAMRRDQRWEAADKGRRNQYGEAQE